jgi:type IV secretory pathway VirB2 component (pilin)
MKKIKTKLVAILILVLVLPMVNAVDFDDPISSEDQATFDQILEPVMKIYNMLKYFATAIAVLVLLWAGIGYMLSGYDPQKRDSSKAMAMYVVIGLVIIWAAPIAVNFIVN